MVQYEQPTPSQLLRARSGELLRLQWQDKLYDIVDALAKQQVQECIAPKDRAKLALLATLRLWRGQPHALTLANVWEHIHLQPQLGANGTVNLVMFLEAWDELQCLADGTG